jgi:hypothetical protein
MAADDNLADNLDDQGVADAIAQLQGMLAPDDYQLVWKPDGPGAISLEIVAGADACAECLVPKPVMLGIVNHLLGDVGVHATELVYPVDAGHPTEEHV